MTEEEHTYEVLEFDEKLIRNSSKVVFKKRADMRQAKADIMNDRDIVIKVTNKGKSTYKDVRYDVLKQALIEKKILFEAEEDN